jgi:hypothetical protein
MCWILRGSPIHFHSVVCRDGDDCDMRDSPFTDISFNFDSNSIA